MGTGSVLGAVAGGDFVQPASTRVRPNASERTPRGMPTIRMGTLQPGLVRRGIPTTARDLTRLPRYVDRAGGEESSGTYPEGRGGWRMDEFLTAAIAEAEAGLAEGGIPIGSVLVHEGQVIGRGHNRRVQKGSAILHGEMDALENAGRLPAAVYTRSVIYTTLSPCAMCSGAILLYRIPRVVVGENVNFMGEEELLRSRGVVVDVLQDARCI